ncbi:MAG: RT0821/Lpp0805 family surface protein [Candidatus Thiodiazotropha sp. (ex. Lucinoma kazani)]
MNRLIAIGLFSIFLLTARSGYSMDLEVLKYSPVRYFTETDWELLKSAAREVLNDKDSNEVITWKNPETGHSGTLEVTRTGKIKGQTCKKMRIHNKANNLEGKAVYLFCQQEDGKWKPSSIAPK